MHIFADISAGTQKPQTKVCGFSLWRLLGPANLRCLFNLDFFQHNLRCVYYDADCSGNHTRVLFSVVCNRGVNILLQLLHAVFVRDAAEYRLTDDFSVPVDNIGGRE